MERSSKRGREGGGVVNRASSLRARAPRSEAGGEAGEGLRPQDMEGERFTFTARSGDLDLRERCTGERDRQPPLVLLKQEGQEESGRSPGASWPPAERLRRPGEGLQEASTRASAKR